MAFNDRIKEARQKKTMTQEQLANRIGVAKSTVTGYERGNSEPSIETIIKIMSALEVDANYLWQDELGDIPIEVSFEHTQYIKKYRLVSDNDTYGKALVDSTINYLCNQIRLLQKKDTQIADLQAQLQACKSQQKQYCYPYIRNIACAGTGFYFDALPTDVINAPYIHGADFILGVDGDSMEPTYHDNDILYIQKVITLAVGETGIFITGNKCVIKEMRENGLVPQNPDYDGGSAYTNSRLIGRVIKKGQQLK